MVRVGNQDVGSDEFLTLQDSSHLSPLDLRQRLDNDGVILLRGTYFLLFAADCICLATASLLATRPNVPLQAP